MLTQLRNRLVHALLLISLVVASAFALSLYRDTSKLTKEVISLTKENASLRSNLDTIEISNRLRVETLNRDVYKLKTEIKNANLKMERQLSDATLATNGLLDIINKLNSEVDNERVRNRIEDDTRRADATRARNLLGQCAKEYERMGAEAERLRNKVTSLQSLITIIKP